MAKWNYKHLGQHMLSQLETLIRERLGAKARKLLDDAMDDVYHAGRAQGITEVNEVLEAAGHPQVLNGKVATPAKDVAAGLAHGGSEVCKGANCAAAPGHMHSEECAAEYTATLHGGRYYTATDIDKMSTPDAFVGSRDSVRRNFDPQIAKFARAMSAKMQRHADTKGNWQTADRTLVCQLLDQALLDGDFVSVGNYAMMLATFEDEKRFSNMHPGRYWIDEYEALENLKAEHHVFKSNHIALIRDAVKDGYIK